MPFSYLNNKSWKEITREERYFVSELYHTTRGNEDKFILSLNNLAKLQLDSASLKINWEIEYEVCFYRDFLKHSSESNRYPQKRTFDLCLFSEERMIIIEAKCQQAFKKVDFSSYKADLKFLLELEFKADVILLASSIYFNNYSKFGKLGRIDNKAKFIEFNGVNFHFITWRDMFETYKNPIFQRADEVYKN